MGVTHLCLALSNFLCNKEGMRTAYIELNATNQIRSLSSDSGKTSFSYQGITIFPGATFTSLPDLLCMEYDYFILDMGVLNTYSVKEFLKCEKQFLVCSLSKWRKAQTIQKLEQLLLNFSFNQKVFRIITCSSKKESKLAVSNGLTFSVVPMPFLQNPFQLPLEFFSFFRKILGVY